MGDHKGDRRARSQRTTPTTPTAQNRHRAQAPTAGKRRASSPPPSLARGRPRRSAVGPSVLGVVAIAASVAGVIWGPADTEQRGMARAQSPDSIEIGSTRTVAARRPVVSRGSSRPARNQESPKPLIAAAEEQAIERAAALETYAAQAAAQSARIESNRWTLPVAYVALTARFGDYGLWANLHTGLDFNGDEGDPIYSVANGTVTAVGYDSAYGNKTVVTLEDGTEIWYCHQSTLLVDLGEDVRGGEQIGTIGATGNVTGSHLHLEVRPGGGDPVDPFTIFSAKGLL
jgi:murein DD-endopeptidase MepM/ murein hydrolase activator NlpD